MNDSSKKRFVNLKLDISNSNNALSFLVDTGSDVSILKIKFINPNAECFIDKSCRLKGISIDYIDTLALINSNIIFNGSCTAKS